MQRLNLLLRLVLLLGAATVVAGSGPPKESCSSRQLALHVSILPAPLPAAQRARSCEVVRSGVDSSIAATGDVIPCLCFLDAWSDFRFPGISIQDVPQRVYVPCGGQHAKEAQVLAARCPGVRHLWSPSPSNKHKPRAVPGFVDTISINSTNL